MKDKKKKKIEIEMMFRNLELSCLKKSIEDFVYSLHDFYDANGHLTEKQYFALRKIFNNLD